MTLIPWVVLGLQIRRYGVNVPFSDQWELVLLIQELNRGELTLVDLFSQHNEQRMLFPRLAMIGLAALTDWNIKLEMVINLGLAFGIFLIAAALLYRTLGPLRGWLVVPVVASSVALSSLVQWENWFWGWQISFFLPLACLFVVVGILTLWPAGRSAWPALLLAGIAAVVGQYSLLSASMIWVVGVPLLWVRPEFRRWLPAWLVVAAAATFVYLRNYTRPRHMEFMHLEPDQLVEAPARPVNYVLYLLGRPVLDAEPQIGVGVAALVLFAVSLSAILIWRRTLLKDALPWILFGLYALGAAVATMAGRLNLGVQQAGSSRYTTMAIVFMISTLVLVSLALLPTGGRPSPGRLAVALSGWLLLVGLFALDYPSEFDDMTAWHAQRLRIHHCLMEANNAGDPCLAEAYPSTTAVFERSRYLQRIGWGGLAGEIDEGG